MGNNRVAEGRHRRPSPVVAASVNIMWDHRSKCWRVWATDAFGRVMHSEMAETTVEFDRYMSRDLVRAVRDKLEAMLPF